MIIEKKFKPSHHKANARYRGVTEHSQYTNFVQESAHDLLMLSHIQSGNEKTGRVGHEKAIFNNFASVMTGSENVSTANLFSAATLHKIDRLRPITTPLLVNWQRVNDATAVTNPADASEVIVSSLGLKDPVGIAMPIYVEPGDALYIRFKIRSTTGAPAFSFGSNNMRISPTEVGDTKKMAIPKNGKSVTVDYVLRFGSAETVTINLNVHQDPVSLVPANFVIKEFEINYLHEQQIQLANYDTQVKPGLDELEEKLNSIR